MSEHVEKEMENEDGSIYRQPCKEPPDKKKKKKNKSQIDKVDAGQDGSPHDNHCCCFLPWRNFRTLSTHNRKDIENEDRTVYKHSRKEPSNKNRKKEKKRAKMNRKDTKEKSTNGAPLNLALPAHPFDPTESVHEWTMWRAAVNRCIVNKVLAQKEMEPKLASRQELSFCLLHVPLKKFIHLGVQSQARANQMSSISTSYILNLNQFVYYGLPRPKVKRNISQGLPKIPVDEFAARYM